MGRGTARSAVEGPSAPLAPPPCFAWSPSPSPAATGRIRMARRSDPLATYNKKRDFAKTAEPAGKLARGDSHSFMVQKHDATRLHYDFRLELDGVLKSWAVP